MSATTDPAAAYEALRAETAGMLKYDLADLSLVQGLQLDLVSLLRLEVDTLQGKVLAGDTVDLNRLAVAFGMLQKILPPAALKAEPPPEVRPRTEARDKLKALIEAVILAGPAHDPGVPTAEARIAELEDEVARLRAELAGAASPPAAAPPAASPAAPSADVVPLRSRELTGAEVAERVQRQMTAPRDEPWRSQYSRSRGIHDIPRNF
jgi:hypothetical protein